MRTGYVIHRFPWPSETFISREIAGLLALGEDIRIYSFERPGSKESALLTPQARDLMARTHYIDRGAAAGAIASPLGLRALSHAYLSLRSAAAGRKLWLLAGRATALAAQARRDGVTHLHAHWPYATLCSHLAARLLGTSYSVSVHAHEVAHENRHFAECFKSLSFASFCNEAAMRYLLGSLPAEAGGKAHLIYHGVDTAKFVPGADPAPPPPIRLLSAGRITRTKGFDRLIRACAAAADRGIPVELTILGQGDAAQQLLALAEELGFSERLKMPGWVSHDEVPGHIAASHAFCLLANTDFNDGLPNVVIEAMAAGRIAIVSPMPAAEEAIEHGRNGFILQSPDDSEGFCAALAALYESPDRAREMGQAAREAVVRKHDAATHLATMRTLLRSAA